MKTQIADVIVPEIFNKYVKEETVKRNALVKAGIVANSAELNSRAQEGGDSINLPFWNGLTGDSEVLSDNGALTPKKITANQDKAVLLMRGSAWSSNDLAEALSGEKPMAAIGNQVADFWIGEQQKIMFSVLEGIFKSTSMSANILDITSMSGSDAYISSNAFLDALQMLGDNKFKITGVAMHSNVETYLNKLNMIKIYPDSAVDPQLTTFAGKNVIVDDECPVSNGVYTTYLFGTGALAYGVKTAPKAVEVGRDILAGDDILVNRQHFFLHPRGVKFNNASVVGASPTNAELANATNWTRVYDPKNIRIIQFKHKIG